MSAAIRRSTIDFWMEEIEPVARKILENCKTIFTAGDEQYTRASAEVPHIEPTHFPKGWTVVRRQRAKGYAKALHAIIMVRAFREKKNYEGAMFQSMLLGARAAECGLRVEQLDAKRGRIVRNGASAGGKSKKLLTHEQEVSCRKQFDRLRRANPRLSKIRTYKLICEPLQVSYKTVARAVDK